MYLTGGVQVPVRGDGHLPAQPADGGGRPARHDGVPGGDQVGAGDRRGTCRGLLRDCTTSPINRFAALVTCPPT